MLKKVAFTWLATHLPAPRLAKTLTSFLIAYAIKSNQYQLMKGFRSSVLHQEYIM